METHILLLDNISKVNFFHNMGPLRLVSFDTFALSRKIKKVAPLSWKRRERLSISFLHYLFEFQVWHPESSPVNHGDIQFSRIDDMPPVCHFYVAPMPFLFFIIPDVSLCCTDIANYFQIPGRRFHFQLNPVSSHELGVEENRVALTTLESLWVPFKNNFQLDFSRTAHSAQPF